MTRRRWALIGGGLVVVAAGVALLPTRPRFDADRAARLEAAVAAWWPPPDRFEPNPTKWPDDVSRLKPRRVYVTASGVFIETERFFVSSSGVFVLPAGSPFVPPANGDPMFRRLASRVYWYHSPG
jgi:hypothetical protein